MRPGRALVALLFVAVLVNLPLLHHAWQQWRLDRDGVEVVATVTDTDVLHEDSDPLRVVRFRLPEKVDPAEQTWPVELDRAAFDRAAETGRVSVRVLPDHPSVQRIAGEQSSRIGYVIIGVVDVVVLLLALLVWRQRRWGREDDAPATLAS